jgi:hypothetical protein
MMVEGELGPLRHKHRDTATIVSSSLTSLLVLALCSSKHLSGFHPTTSRPSTYPRTLGLRSYRFDFVGESSRLRGEYLRNHWCSFVADEDFQWGAYTSYQASLDRTLLRSTC